MGAQVDRVAADADGVPDTAGVTRAVVEGDPAAGIAAGLEAARGAGLLALEERRKDQHDQGLRTGLLGMEADGSVRSDPQLVIPYGGMVRVDGPARRITVTY